MKKAVNGFPAKVTLKLKTQPNLQQGNKIHYSLLVQGCITDHPPKPVNEVLKKILESIK